MPTYDTDTTENQQEVDELLSIVRPVQAEILRLSQKCEVAVALWNAKVSAIVAAYDAGSTIPNETGLDGADALTKENLANNLMAYVTSAGGFSTSGHIENMLPAGGATNIL